MNMLFEMITKPSTMICREFLVFSLLMVLVDGVSELPGKMCVDQADGAPICYYAFKTPATKDEAMANCASFEASLIMPTDYDQNYDLADFLVRNALQRSWIGALEEPLTWDEVTGSITQPWAPGKPDSNADYKACVTLPHDEDFKWDHDACTSKHGFICERAGTEAECEGSNQFFISPTCHTYNGAAQATWFQAIDACKQIDNTLLVMEGFDAFAISVNLLKKKLTQTFWIGHTTRLWRDSKNNELTFFDWDDGQPSHNEQKCAVMLDDGLWMDRDCSVKIPYVCERKCASGIHGNPTCLEKANGDYQSCTICDGYNTCSGGAISENRECAEPGQIWDDSSKRCEISPSTCLLPIAQVDVTTPGEEKDSNDLYIGLGVSAAVLIILAIAIGIGVHYTRKRHAKSPPSLDAERKLTDDEFSVISNESHPDFAKARRYAHETFLDSDAGTGERYWTWRAAGTKNVRM